jgi:hypothetical protein
MARGDSGRGGWRSGQRHGRPAVVAHRSGRIRCFGPQFSMRFSPTALGRRGEPILLSLGGQRETMVAGVGEAARLKLGVDGGGL